jgi:hypothetical protein
VEGKPAGLEEGLTVLLHVGIGGGFGPGCESN